VAVEEEEEEKEEEEEEEEEKITCRHKAVRYPPKEGEDE